MSRKPTKRQVAAALASPAALPLQLRLGVLDLVPFGAFSADDARALFDELGDAGRARYAGLYASGADVAFPLCLTAALLCAAASCAEGCSLLDARL